MTPLRNSPSCARRRNSTSFAARAAVLTGNECMKLLGQDRPIVAMIHVGGLPGTPASDGPLERVIERAVREARLYERGGVDALLIENMHDVPYLNGGVGPEITAAMTAVGAAGGKPPAAGGADSGRGESRGAGGGARDRGHFCAGGEFCVRARRG